MSVVNVIVLMDASCGQYDVGSWWGGGGVSVVVIMWDRRVRVYAGVRLNSGRVYPLSVLQGCGIQNNQSSPLPIQSCLA